MKKTKNAMFAVLGGLLILSVATVSCKKKSSPSPVATITNVLPNPATPGATVTITGTNFTGTATVSINGGAAIAATVVNGTTITFIAPAATTGALVATVNGTPIPYTGGTFTVNVPGPTSDSVATSALLAKWTFDTNAAEAISTDVPYKAVGVTYGGAGKIGGCATFTAGYLLYNPISQINNNTTLESYTISLWANMPAQLGTDPLRPLFQMTGNRYSDIWGQVDLELTNNNTITGDSLTIGARQHQQDGYTPFDHLGITSVNAGLPSGIANNWILLTETYNGNGNNQTMQIYINGNRVDSAEFTDVTKPQTFNLVPQGGTPTVAPLPATKVYIGSMAFFDQGNTAGDGYNNYAPTWNSANYSWAGEAITGKLDDIRVYNRALTASEVALLYTYGSQGK